MSVLRRRGLPRSLGVLDIKSTTLFLATAEASLRLASEPLRALSGTKIDKSSESAVKCKKKSMGGGNIMSKITLLRVVKVEWIGE